MTTSETKNKKVLDVVCNVEFWLLNLSRVIFEIGVRIYEGQKEGLCVFDVFRC